MHELVLGHPHMCHCRELIDSSEGLQLGVPENFNSLVNILRVLREWMNSFRTSMRTAMSAVIGTEGCTTVNVSKFIGRRATVEEVNARRRNYINLLGINADMMLRCSKGAQVGDSYITEAGMHFHQAIMGNAELYAWMFDVWAVGRLTGENQDEEYMRSLRVNGSWILAHWVGAM